MIVSTVKIDSLLLRMPVEIKIAIPYKFLNSWKKYRLLLCFHDLCSDGSLFTEKMNTLEYIEEKNIVLVAPGLGNSLFVNSSKGRFGDFLDMELYPMLFRMLPLSDKRADHYLLGVSTGAYGALEFYIRHPEFFKKTVFISGYFDSLIPQDEALNTQRDAFALHRAITPVMNTIVKDQGRNYSIYKRIDSFSDKKNGILEFYCGDHDLLTLNQNTRVSHYSVCTGVNASFDLVHGEHDIRTFNRALNLFMNRL
ncbi:MAG: alpha/beta hydrolase-fold protein [Succinivibrio sp.]